MFMAAFTRWIARVGNAGGRHDGRLRSAALRAKPCCTVLGKARCRYREARMSWPVPHRRELLARLYLSRAPFRVIAQEYGGTPHGVRSTVRKMIERGELMQREQRRDPNTGQFA
jgi:hypothetical protein